MSTHTEKRVMRMPLLHAGQVEVHTSPARFKVLACGAQWGKSMLASAEAIACAAIGGHCWWIFPDHPLATIGWTYLTGLAKQIPWCEIREGERMIRFPGNGGFAQIKSTGQLLRGRPLDLAIFDEAAYTPEDSWEREVAPRLSTRKGKALFISTPCGYNWFHKLYEMGQDPAFSDWASWKFPTASNPFIDSNEIEAAKARLSWDSFRQEYLADFVVRSGAVFPMFSRALHVREVEIDHNLPIFVGIDFGFRTFAAVLFQITSAGEVHVIGEMECNEQTTEAAIRRLTALPYGNGKPLAARIETIGCDPAGDSRNLQTGRSDVQVLRGLIPSARVMFSTSAEHRSPEWGAARIRDMLLSADGKTRLYVAPHCRGTIRMMESMVYPEHREGSAEKPEPVKDGVNDHLFDALRYGLVNAGVFGRVGARGMQVAWL